MATSKIKSLTEVPMKQVANNYGFRVYYTRSGGVNIVHVEGDAFGAVGTHSFTITDSDFLYDGTYRMVFGFGSGLLYSVSLLQNTVTIKGEGATLPQGTYVNATFVY